MSARCHLVWPALRAVRRESQICNLNLIPSPVEVVVQLQSGFGRASILARDLYWSDSFVSSYRECFSTWVEHYLNIRGNRQSIGHPSRKESVKISHWSAVQLSCNDMD